MINEQRITYRMKTLIESGFFGNKTLLIEGFADKDKVRLFQAAYNYTYDKDLAVDGIKGAQTDAAIADAKKQLNVEKLDDAGAKELYIAFLAKLDQNKANINVGQGGVNTNKRLNHAIQAIINLAGQPIGIDGVIGTKTIGAIKAIAEDSEVINSDNITTITAKAAKNALQLGVEGISTVQGGAANTPEQVEAESRKAWVKYPCVAKADGIKEDKQKDGSIAYVDKDNAFIYFANGRRMNINNSTKESYYCNGMTVTIGVMSDNTKVQGKCETGNCVDGQGTLILPNKRLEGTFVGGILTGENNTIIYLKDGEQDGNSFSGETKNNKPFKGIYRHKDGSMYSGYFNSSGDMHGNNSTYTNPKGKKWIGNFTNGKPDGATFKELDAVENDNVATNFPTNAMLKNANTSKFKEDMKKLKSIIDEKIANNTMTIQNDIAIGNFLKGENNLQIFDKKNNLIYTSTSVSEKIKVDSGIWNYYTGADGGKILTFGNKNNVYQDSVGFPKELNAAEKAQIEKNKQSYDKAIALAKENEAKRKQGFNEDMKKLVNIIKDYTQQWGYYYVTSNSINFKDNYGKQIFTTTNLFSEVKELPDGRVWAYKPDAKTITFYEPNKIFYTHKIT